MTSKIITSVKRAIDYFDSNSVIDKKHGFIPPFDFYSLSITFNDGVILVFHPWNYIDYASMLRDQFSDIKSILLVKKFLYDY